MVIDSATASGPGGRPAAVTASSRTVGEDEDAGTGLSLVIDGVRHLQITTRPVAPLKRPAQTLASRLCSDPAPCPAPGRLVPLPLGHPTAITANPLTYW